MITFEKFKELFDELETSEKVSIFNSYCYEHGDADNALEAFDEEFFNTYFDGVEPIEICRATFFGNIQSWNDDYIRFNAYGNLESVSEFDAEDYVNDYIEDIYNCPDVWEDYIEDDEDEDENEGDE